MMAEEEYQFINRMEKYNEEKEKRRKHGKKKLFVNDTAKVVEKLRHVGNPQGVENFISDDGRDESRKTKKKRHLMKDSIKIPEEQEVNLESALKGVGLLGDEGLAERKKDKKNRSLEEAEKGQEEQEVIKSIHVEGNLHSDGKAETKNKRKKQLLKEATKAKKCGVCYLSRIPRHMDPLQLRHILSQYGEIQRIYLIPEKEKAAAQVHASARVRPAARVRAVAQERRKRIDYLEGWVEFLDKRVAKRVANMLNGEQIGGRKRSSFYYDLWNIKYLSKFKWDDLTEEIAYKTAIREQKLALEISAAKKERDFYLSKVEKSRALSAIDERLKKRQKHQGATGTNPDQPISEQASRVVRQFPQTQPIADNVAERKPRLSKDVLSGVFGGP
ncbi:hypothetical protein FNV43_RR03174 [Rhamnella rubrinervis]|uniref:Activator of basal transcription 1 n=1 Tax=Rhamnella rubrinervis TaxID=2594499 RepID=A0A8K0HHW5_9ROSA|nr:hypothetical protein FNV43_RR03174 [Rhamnella rubrinervis]